MSIILYVFSLIWIAAGSCFILYTGQSRGFVRQLLDEIPVRVLAAAAILVGLLLLYAAPAARNSWFVTLLGLLGIIKGGLFLANPLKVYERLGKWYTQAAGDTTYRFFGIVGLIFGTALLSWIY